MKIIMVILLLSSLLFCQTTRYVPQQYSTIQAALNVAQTGDNILVGPGTYCENLIWPNKSGIKLTALTSGSIIDGTKKSSTMTFLHTSIDSNTIISGFSIVNGLSDKGGGIIIINGSPKFLHCSIENNSAQKGGGIYIESSGAILDDVIIRNNETIMNSNGIGGGIYYENVNSKPILRNSTIEFNRSSTIGGGIYIGEYSDLKCYNIKVLHNENGGIYISGSTPIIENSQISYNYYKIPDHGFMFDLLGGGIALMGFSWEGQAILKNVLISHNQAVVGGGLFIQSACLIQNCIIINNISSSKEFGKGGGIYFDARGTLENTIIADNFSDKEGGGIYSNANLNLNNVLLTRNYAQTGPGLYNDGILNITNSTICFNQGTRSSGIYTQANTTVSDCNFYKNGSGIINPTNSFFVEAQNNWWGTSKGPYNSLMNPPGVEDSTSTFVNVVPFSLAPNQDAPLIPISSFSLSNIDHKSIKVVWNPIPNMDSKLTHIFWSTDSLCIECENSREVYNDTSIIISDLTPGQKYFFSIRYVDNFNRKSWYSSQKSIRVLTPDYLKQVPQEYASIQAALNAAQSGDTVLVSPGRYYENLRWPINKNVKLLSSDSNTNTIIDGSNNDVVIYMEGTGLINNSTIIKGFSIVNGKGALKMINSSPILESLVIKENYDYVFDTKNSPNLKVFDSVIEDNYGYIGSLSYGSIYNSNFLRNNGPLANCDTIFNCLFSHNKGGVGAYAIIKSEISYNSDSDIVLTNILIATKVIANYSANGKIISTDGLYMNKSIVVHNVSYSSAISSNNGVWIDSSVIASNKYIYGPSIWAKSGEINYCTISSNISEKECAGIQHSGSMLKILKSNLYANRNHPHYALINRYTGSLEISSSNIFNNSIAAMSYSESQIEAVNNYWGSDQGPYQPWQNPTGKGDSVNLYVNVLPFLTQPDTTAPPLPITSLTLRYTTSNSIELEWESSPSGDVKGYKIYWSTDTVNYTYSTSMDIGLKELYTISNLMPGLAYRIAVTCYDNTGNESWFSNEIIAITIPPILNVVESGINFPEVPLQDSLQIPIHIVSGDSSPLLINSIENSFQTFQTEIKLPKIVNGFDTLEVPVKFKPSSYGTFTDTLHIITTGGTANILLSGESPYPVLQSQVETVQFGTVVRTQKASKILKFTNPSINELILDSIFTKSTYFSVHPNSGTIKRSDTLYVLINFSTADFGIFSDTLKIYNNSEDKIVNIPLTANTPFQIIFNGANLNYGNVAVGDSSTQTILLGNIFNGPTVIDDIYTNSTVFQVSPSSASLDPLDTLEIQIRFIPNEFKTYKDTVYIVNSSLNTNLWISLTGTSPSPLAITDASALIFDSTIVNTTSSKVLHITNTSINALEVTSIATNSKYFNVSDGKSFIFRGDTLDIQVEFTPEEVGNFNDTLFIFNNSTAGILKIPLFGISKQVSSVDKTEMIPDQYCLYQNFPNPFNPSTLITYDLPEPSQVRIMVYNTLGEVICELVNEEHNAGCYQIQWNAVNLASGVYLYSLSAISEKNNKQYFTVNKLMIMK